MTDGLKPIPKWRTFERAVVAVLRALEPGARVVEDAPMADADHGGLRQRAVWIGMPIFGGQAVAKVLVRRKRKKKPLSVQDLDAFWGGKERARAHMASSSRMAPPRSGAHLTEARGVPFIVDLAPRLGCPFAWTSKTSIACSERAISKRRGS